MPGWGAALTPLWRTRQFEYTWLRTAAHDYADFWQCTADALRFAAASLHLELAAAQHGRLMNAYLTLQPWPDALAALHTLRQNGLRLGFLSNFTPAMLDAAIEGGRLQCGSLRLPYLLAEPHAVATRRARSRAGCCRPDIRGSDRIPRRSAVKAVGPHLTIDHHAIRLMTSPNTSAPITPNAVAEPLIRPYRADDGVSLRDCIAELQDAERSIEGRLRPGRTIASEYLATMLEDCRRYAGQVFVLEVDGVVAGFTTVFARVPFERLDEPPGDYALVAELVVRPEYRRRGYARALLAHGEKYAASQGAAELRIGVLSDNTAARTLYLDTGFRPYLETLAKSPAEG